MDTPIEKLRELFIQRKTQWSDIQDHMDTLVQYGNECAHITEFGTRHGNSTTAFLWSIPKKLVCYDLHKKPEVDELAKIAKQMDIAFEFRNEDTGLAAIEETDLLFIDSLHEGKHVERELTQYDKVRKYIIFHDVVTFGLRGVNGGQGILIPIFNFLESRHEWVVDWFSTESNGLLVLANSYGVGT